MCKRSPVKLIIIFIMTTLLFACASTPPKPSDRTPEAVLDPIDEVNKIENEINAARQNQINVLSPSMFAKAENAYLKAKNKAEKDNDISVVLEYTDMARTYLHNAEENAKIARTVLENVIESRNKARIAGATKLEEDYRKVEDRFLSLTQAIEKDNIFDMRKTIPLKWIKNCERLSYEQLKLKPSEKSKPY